MTDSSQRVFATNTGIVDDELEAVRALIGEELRLPALYNRSVTVDAIRHFAHSYGDDNPIFCNEDYGRDSVLGSVVAPPTFLYSVFSAGIGPGFGGLQGFHAGGRWEFARRLVPGDQIVVSGKLVAVRDIEGRRSGRTIIQTGRAEYRSPAGELLATNVASTFRKPRPGFAGAMQFDDHVPYQLTEEARVSIEEQIATYPRRGALPRYWEETVVGEEIAVRPKGPLELNDITVFSVGVGIVHSGEIALKGRRRARLSPSEVHNTRPLEWLTDRVPAGQGHLDPAIARAVGIPNPYDNGYLRVCWMAHLVTDWMGDASRLVMLDVKIRLPNIVGDVLYLSGRVTRVYRNERDEPLVDVDIAAHRHDGELSCEGTASVRLPSVAELAEVGRTH